FKLERSGHRADNLCEGEKTAIAFSHFMTTLEDRNTNLADTIVFIDDPVSSLDCNHLFHTYAFIESKLVDCKQLFISTHNYEFFNLIKAWQERNGKYPNTSLYLIEKTKNGTDAPFKSNLKELPGPLSKFKSEYVYLFSLLHKFNEKTITDYDYLYILPNLVRRYLEAYVGFRTLGSLKQNLSILIEDKTKQAKVYKLINAYSHNSSSPRLLHFPDRSECKDVVKIVLKAVQDKDKEHYEALVKKTG
ncbi:AAA family ATPase, partial [bacterium]|nr:AAA family ATPase [bacterium]